MDSKYVFGHVDKFREESLLGMGRLSYKLKNEARRIMKEKDVTKEDLTEVYQEIGNELKEKITKLANIGKELKALEKNTAEIKDKKISILEIQMEIFQNTIELQENTRDLLNETIELYEQEMESGTAPSISKDERFHNSVENIVKGINDMILELEDIFDERLKNKKKYGGTRAFYISGN